MERANRDVGTIVFNFLIVCIGTIGVLLTVFMPDSKGVVTGTAAFRYFTVDGSILSVVAAAVALITRIFGVRQNNKVFFLKFTATVTTTMIFIGALMMVPIMGRGLIYETDMFLLHIVNPALCLFSFLIFDERRIEYKHEPILHSLIPMIVYGIAVITLCATKVWTGDEIPYPFLDFYNTNIFISILIIAIILIVAGAVAYILDMLNAYFDDELDEWHDYLNNCE